MASRKVGSLRLAGSQHELTPLAPHVFGVVPEGMTAGGILRAESPPPPPPPVEEGGVAKEGRSFYGIVLAAMALLAVTVFAVGARRIRRRH